MVFFDNAGAVTLLIGAYRPILFDQLGTVGTFLSDACGLDRPGWFDTTYSTVTDALAAGRTALSAEPPKVATPVQSGTPVMTGSGFPAGKALFSVDKTHEPWIITFSVADSVRVHECGSDKTAQYEAVPGTSIPVAQSQRLEMWTPSISSWSTVVGADRCTSRPLP